MNAEELRHLQAIMKMATREPGIKFSEKELAAIRKFDPENIMEVSGFVRENRLLAQELLQKYGDFVSCPEAPVIPSMMEERFSRGHYKAV